MQVSYFWQASTLRNLRFCNLNRFFYARKLIQQLSQMWMWHSPARSSTSKLKAEFLERVKSFEDFIKVDALFEDTRIKTVWKKNGVSLRGRQAYSKICRCTKTQWFDHSCLWKSNPKEQIKVPVSSCRIYCCPQNKRELITKYLILRTDYDGRGINQYLRSLLCYREITAFFLQFR